MLVPAGKEPKPVLAWQRAAGRSRRRRRHWDAGCLAAQVVAALEHVNLEVPLDQLVCRGQPSNSAADDDHFFAHGRDPRCCHLNGERTKSFGEILVSSVLRLVSLFRLDVAPGTEKTFVEGRFLAHNRAASSLLSVG